MLAGRITRHGLVISLVGATLAFASPASAAPDTAITIAAVTTNGISVSMSGTVVVGDTAKAAVSVMSDGQGDSLNAGLVPDGLDLASGNVSVASDGKLVFTINTFNMSPTIGAQAPTFVYDWNVMVDGTDNGHFLQAGYVGGFGAANPGKFFNLCKRAGNVTCTNLGAAGGTIGTPNDTATIKVSLSQISAQVGSIIEAGSAGGTTCSGICSTWQPVAAILYNTGGDQADPGGYIVPGGLQLTVVTADTPDDEIGWEMAVPVTPQANGSYTKVFTPEEDLLSGLQYKAAARSCSGSTEAPVCVLATKIFTA